MDRSLDLGLISETLLVCFKRYESRVIQHQLNHPIRALPFLDDLSLLTQGHLQGLLPPIVATTESKAPAQSGLATEARSTPSLPSDPQAVLIALAAAKQLDAAKLLAHPVTQTQSSQPTLVAHEAQAIPVAKPWNLTATALAIPAPKSEPLPYGTRKKEYKPALEEPGMIQALLNLRRAVTPLPPATHPSASSRNSAGDAGPPIFEFALVPEIQAELKSNRTQAASGSATSSPILRPTPG